MASRSMADVVIPVFNQVAFTRICLASLAAADLDGATVTVVDNGSTDGTAALLAKWKSGGRLRRVITMKSNAGFAVGCNTGAAAGSAEMVVFLNNDTFVLPDWLPRLLEPFADAGIMATGSRLLYPNGRIQHAGLAFDERGPHHIFAGLPADHAAVVEPREWQAVTGAAIAVRRTEFERLNGFDQTYRNSFEDVDLCLRIRAAEGRILYVPSSTAYHFESVTDGRLGATDDANYERFIGRWRGRFTPDLRPALAAAEAAGQDLTDRVPPKHEALAALRTTESQLEIVQRSLAHAEAEVAFYRSVPGLRPLLAARRIAARAFHALPRSVKGRLRRPPKAGDDAAPSTSPPS